MSTVPVTFTGLKRLSSVPPRSTVILAPMPAFFAAAAAGGSTIGTSTRPWYFAFISAARIALLSPVAPDEVASAASVKMTGPCMCLAWAIAASSGISLPCMQIGRAHV